MEEEWRVISSFFLTSVCLFIYFFFFFILLSVGIIVIYFFNFSIIYFILFYLFSFFAKFGTLYIYIYIYIYMHRLLDGVVRLKPRYYQIDKQMHLYVFTQTLGTNRTRQMVIFHAVYQVLIHFRPSPRSVAIAGLINSVWLQFFSYLEWV